MAKPMKRQCLECLAVYIPEVDAQMPLRCPHCGSERSHALKPTEMKEGHQDGQKRLLKGNG